MKTTHFFRPLLLTSALILAAPALANNWMSVYQPGVQGDTAASQRTSH